MIIFIVCIIITISFGFSHQFPVHDEIQSMTAEQISIASKALQNDIKHLPIHNPNGTQRTAISKASRVWPNGIVYYAIPNNFGVVTMLGIMSTLSEMSKEIGKRMDGSDCITFKVRTSEPNYLYFIDDEGCYSYVGRVGGPQEVSLDSTGCLYTGTVMHETMHALGFNHEMTRNDRDDYVTIHYENIIPDKFDQFDKNEVEDELLYAPFDLDSIMIYGNQAFSKNDFDTMTAKNGQRILEPYAKSHLTPYNIQEIRSLYKCDALPNVTTLKPDTTTRTTSTRTTTAPSTTPSTTLTAATRSTTTILCSFIFCKVVISFRLVL